MLPEEMAAASAASTPAGATVKPKGKKPPAAPPGLTSPVSTAASGSAGGGGTAPAASGTDVLKLKKTQPGKTPEETLGIVSDDLGMYAGALSTVPGATAEIDMNTLLGVEAAPNEDLVGKSEIMKNAYSGPLPDLAPGIMIGGMPIQQPTLPSYASQMSEEQREEREAVLPQARKLRGTKRGGKIEKDVLTSQEYAALSEDERAAIDFNTMALQVTSRDKKMQDEYMKPANKPTDEEMRLYDATVTEMFGSDGGSLTFAPETVALLKQIEFKDEAADLDDFLDLKVLITNDDLKAIDFNTPLLAPVTPDGNPQQQLHEMQSTLALNTEAMADELIQGENMLQTIGAAARVDRNSAGDIESLGGLQRSVGTQLGFGSGEEDRKFQGFFGELVAAGADAPALFKTRMAAVAEDWKPKILDYLERRSLQFDRFDIPFGEEGDGLLTPEEFRKALGLGEGNISRKRTETR